MFELIRELLSERKIKVQIGGILLMIKQSDLGIQQKSAESDVLSHGNKLYFGRTCKWSEWFVDNLSV